MEKICSPANVLGITIPDALADFNNEFNTHRARLTFVYLGTTFEEIVGIDDEAQALLASCRSTAPYSCIIDLSSIDGKDDEEKAENLFEKLKGKSVLMTTFILNVSDINPNEVHANNGERTYSSFSDSYIGIYNDDTAAYQRIRDRINKQIENGDIEWGEYVLEETQSKGRRH